MLKKTEPLTLLDLKPKHESVPVNDGQSIDIYGISAEDVVALFLRFPPLQGVMVGRGIDPVALLKLGPKVVSSMIAAGTGNLGDEAHEAAASRLSIDVQLAILEALGRCTFTSGFGPFAKRLRAIAGVLSVEDGRDQATRSPRPSKRLVEPPTKESGT